MCSFPFECTDFISSRYRFFIFIETKTITFLGTNLQCTYFKGIDVNDNAKTLTVLKFYSTILRSELIDTSMCFM